MWTSAIVTAGFIVNKLSEDERAYWMDVRCYNVMDTS
jgi:hypothetical protein